MTPAIHISPDALRAWRDAQGHHLQALARVFDAPVQSVSAWEQGLEPIPRRIALHILNNPAGVRLGETIDKDNLPGNEAERILYAQRMAYAYIQHMEQFAAIFGADAPAAFCVSYWKDGACQAPRLYFGVQGVLPDPVAVKAAWAIIRHADELHIIERTLVQLDECPADVRAFVLELDAAPVAPVSAPVSRPRPRDVDPAQAVAALEEELHGMLLRREVPWANLLNIWSGLTYGLASVYKDRPDIRNWIMAQPYGLAERQDYAEVLGPYWRQWIAGPVGALPPGARNVEVRG